MSDPTPVRPLDWRDHTYNEVPEFWAPHAFGSFSIKFEDRFDLPWVLRPAGKRFFLVDQSGDMDKREARSKTTKSGTLTIRLRESLRAEMERVASAGPYPISFTAIVERGILLAICELDEIAARAKKVGGAR